MAEPKKCPVCDGIGKVPYNFYKDKEQDLKIFTEKCRICDGTGILWDYNTLTSYPVMEDYVQTMVDNPCEKCPVRTTPGWNGICHCTLGSQGKTTW